MISLTEKASNKVKQQLMRRGKGEGLRIAVKTTGCSGFAYVLEYVDVPNEDDYCIESYGCKVFVDPKTSIYLKGLEIDYIQKGLNEGFEFNNPNERDRCGCGESFRI